MRRCLIRVDFERLDDLAHWLAIASQQVNRHAHAVLDGGFYLDTITGRPASGLLRLADASVVDPSAQAEPDARG